MSKADTTQSSSFPENWREEEEAESETPMSVLQERLWDSELRKDSHPEAGPEGHGRLPDLRIRRADSNWRV